MSEPLPSAEPTGVDTNIKPGAPAPSMPAAPPLAYQALSGWAIAGFALGAMFALMVVACAIISFYQGAPFFLYQWLVGIAILGVFVSLYGQRHVRTSEGTLAGAKLAQWGFRLSLVSGLLYVVYYLVTGWAVTSQANTFVMEEGEDAGFFARMRKAADNPVELNKAFLLTRPPNDRSGRPEDERSMRKSHDIPKDGTAGFLTQFRETAILPRILFHQLGKEAEITPLDVQDWKYENRSYLVHRVYHIKTKEVELDYLLVVQSAEGEATGQGRKWFINLLASREVPGTPKATPIGVGMAHLRKRAGEFLTQRIAKINERAEKLELAKLDDTPWEAISPKDQVVERKSRMHQAFAGKGTDTLHGFQLAHPPEMPGKWEHVAGKIRVHLLFRGTLTKDIATPTGYMFEGIASLETKQVIDPATFTDGSAADWSVVSVNFTAMTVPEDKRLPNQKKDLR